jgi:hypothetical protein
VKTLSNTRNVDRAAWSVRSPFTLHAPRSTLHPLPKKVRYFCILVLLGASCVIHVGCADNEDKPTTRPMTARERQDAALKDPFSYGPNGQMMENPNISGGGLSDFDKKAFKHDVDDVLNP